jgi:hypothetical protein
VCDFVGRLGEQRGALRLHGKGARLEAWKADVFVHFGLRLLTVLFKDDLDLPAQGRGPSNKRFDLGHPMTDLPSSDLRCSRADRIADVGLSQIKTSPTVNQHGDQISP